jgi:hypothetical protein
MHQLNRWSIFPVGYWTERDGSSVVFYGRPICRKRPTGEIEIVSMSERIDSCEEHRFYLASNHPADELLLSLVQKFRPIGVKSNSGSPKLNTSSMRKKASS